MTDANPSTRIQAEDNKALARWLRQQRLKRNWSQHRMARMLTEAADDEGERISCLESIEQSVYRWERGMNRPTERFRWFYCRAFGIPPAEFGPSPADALPSRLLPTMKPAQLLALNDLSQADIVQCLATIREVINALLDSAEQLPPQAEAIPPAAPPSPEPAPPGPTEDHPPPSQLTSGSWPSTAMRA